MERRKAVIAAATASLTLLAGAAAISINSGLVGASGSDGVGTVQPIDATTPSTVHVDGPAAGDSTPRSEEDDGHGVTRRDDRSHEVYEHEYEGAEDDD
jgi:hypothetical protein